MMAVVAPSEKNNDALIITLVTMWLPLYQWIQHFGLHGQQVNWIVNFFKMGTFQFFQPNHQGNDNLFAAFYYSTN